MKKSKFLAGTAGLVAAVLAVGGIFWGIQKWGLRKVINENVSAESENALRGDLEEWGRCLAQSARERSDSAYSMDGEEAVYAVGENATVLCRDIEQAKEYYIISGLGEGKAEKRAIKQVYEREALYQEALKNGYSVTDEEIEEYLRQMRENVETAENKEEIQVIIKQFPTEESYWEYEFFVYEKNLPIEKYVQDKMADYREISRQETMEGWETYYSRLKEELVEKENYKKL